MDAPAPASAPGPAPARPRVKYLESLSRALRALKCGGLWAFGGTGLAAVLGIFAVVAAAAAVSGLDRAVAEAIGVDGEEAVFIGIFVWEFVIFAAMLLAVPVALVVYGGLLHASAEALAGGRVRVRDAWASGGRSFGRLLGVEGILFGAYLTGMALAYTVGFVPLLATAAGSEEPGPFFAAAFCCAYPVMLGLFLVVVVTWQAVEALASRYALLGGRGFLSSVGAGWRAFRSNLRNVLGFALVTLGLTYAWQMVASMFTSPFMLPAMLSISFSGADPDPRALADSMKWVFFTIPISYAAYTPFLLFVVTAWTDYVSRLTGETLPWPASGPVELPPAPAPPGAAVDVYLPPPPPALVSPEPVEDWGAEDA